jgi:uncharacterized protein YdeI (YjbR/CyaY-like superfamily)
MASRNKAFDAYIANAPEYAKPILEKIRETVNGVSPEIEEELKWGHPSFTYKGILCGMAAFKEYCAFHFWKGGLILEDKKQGEQMWAQLGKLRSIKDLPPKKVIQGYVKKAMELNDLGTQAPKRPTKPKKPLAMPDSFMAAIRKNKQALVTYEKFAPSHQREYIEWITDAKTDETRDRRIEQAVEWMSQGKPRNWKYMR